MKGFAHYKLLLSLLAGWLAPGCGSTETTSENLDRLFRVDDIARSSFRRVAGEAVAGAALDTGPEGSWYARAVTLATVDYDGRSYRLWFVGSTQTEQPGIPYGWIERIGLATSRDGQHWAVANRGQPVLDLGPPGKFDDAGVTHPYVLRVGDRFMMWYGGIDGSTAGDLGLEPEHVRIERVGLAISQDGIHWERANDGDAVMDIGPAGSIDSIQATGMHVLNMAPGFTMWYGAYNGRHSIGIASSSDGIHWRKMNRGQAVTGLQGHHQLGPSVYFDGHRYLMLYNTSLKTEKGGNLWAAYGATSADGVHWARAFEGQPLLEPPPAGNFDGADGHLGNNHSVHPTKVLPTGDRVRVWYSAEAGKPRPGQPSPPSRIGLMEAVVSNPPVSRKGPRD